MLRPNYCTFLPPGLAILSLLISCGSGVTTIDESRQATGVKVGEVTETSAIVWMRVTEKAARRADGIERRGRPDRSSPEVVDPLTLEGSVPGAPGRVRLRYGTSEDLAGAKTAGWRDVDPGSDFTHKIRLVNLEPATVYYYSAETSSLDGSVVHQPLCGRFETAPPAGEHADVTFTVITGQAYRDADDEDGFLIYDAMGALNPKFIVPTGDTVYYDSDDPIVTSIELARYHWHRIYSYSKLIDFHLKAPGYWEKDDHDSYANDNWPGLVRDYMGTFSLTQGLKVYEEQVPMSVLPYRTFRWGKGLQVWVVEGRDYRSPNDMKDGPEKTIWGGEQKRWLKNTLLASDADWRVLISPTPIVGPDRANKGDNHSNKAFQHEGDEIRQWVKENVAGNLFVACGDRHWQYHSVHPKTGLHEFSCGPVSDQHAGGTPGENPEYHKFHRVKGGFLSVTVERAGDGSTISFRFHDVNGNVQYEYTR